MPRFFVTVILFFFGTAVATADDSSLLGYRYLGPSDILIADDPNELLILEIDAQQVRKIRSNGTDVPKVLPLPIRPERMALFPDNKRLAIVGNGPRGKLLIVNVEAWTIEQTISVGHSPSHVAVFQDGDAVTLYVANRFDGTVSVVDGKEGKETARRQAGREPAALAVTPDGSQLVVVGQIPEDSSLNHRTTSRVRIFDTKTGDVTEIPLRHGAMNLRDIVLSGDGRYAFITGIVGHFEQVPSQVSGGWMNENAVFVVDVHAGETANVLYVDDYMRGGGNPWGISLSDDERFLVVAHAGSCEISLLTMHKVLEVLDNRAGSKGSSERPPLPEIDRSLSMQLRVPVGLKGVRHAVMRDGLIFASAYFEDCVVKIQPEISEPVSFVPGYVIGRDPLDWESERSRNRLESNEPLHFVSLPRFDLMKGVSFQRSFARLGPPPMWNSIRHGEMLFHDAVVCLEHWQSCASCHPDARSDTLNWDLLNDGIGNPKNTKSMLFSHETPPSMARGVRESAELAVRKGFEVILFARISEEDACDVDAYLQSLLPVPSPKLVYAPDGSTSLSESAKRGKRIFDGAAGCADCHPEPLFTDLKMHDVGTRSIGDSSSLYDTPTLVEVWRTAPYLHDGRYNTLRELIVEGKHVEKNGRFDELSEADIDDLIEYVLSL